MDENKIKSFKLRQPVVVWRAIHWDYHPLAGLVSVLYDDHHHCSGNYRLVLSLVSSSDPMLNRPKSLSLGETRFSMAARSAILVQRNVARHLARPY